MINKYTIAGLSLVAAISILASNAHASGYKIKSEDGDKYLKVGGRIQLQYHRVMPDGGDDSDELFFRRLRPYIEGSLHKDWKAKFQVDFGKSKTSLKDAYFQYKGFDGMNISVGNVVFPFSLEQRTSSKKQQLVERTLVGDHNYGSPDRQAGLHIHGNAADKMVQFGGAVAMGAIDSSNSKLDFDSVVQIDKGDDWQEGPMVGASIDLYPLGAFSMSQADFGGDVKLNIGAAAFYWANDDDNNEDNGGDVPMDEVVDNVTGGEIHGGFRGAGFSVDAQYNVFKSELNDNSVTDGLYENGETTLQNAAIEGGFMFWPKTMEIVGGYEWQTADNYAEDWTRISGGLNWYINKHNTKLQLTYRAGQNVKGKKDNDEDELFVQAQYVF